MQPKRITYSKLNYWLHNFMDKTELNTTKNISDSHLSVFANEIGKIFESKISKN